MTLLQFVVLYDRPPDCVIRVSHNCLHCADGASAFALPDFHRISPSPGPLPLPNSFTLILLCYYPRTQRCCFIFYFLPQALSCRLLDGVCLLGVCVLHWGNGRVEPPFVYMLSEERRHQSMSVSRKHPNRNAADRGRGRAPQLNN